MALAVPACQPGWEEIENLRGNSRKLEESVGYLRNFVRKFERKELEMKSAWEEAPRLKSPWFKISQIQWSQILVYGYFPPRAANFPTFSFYIHTLHNSIFAYFLTYASMFY